MAGEERLRLIAEFRDNASAGVRRLGRELGEVRQTPGMAAATRWMQGFTLNAKGIQMAGAGAGSVMSSLGIGGLAAAGGIAAAVKSFKDLADQKIALQSLSRETGLAVDQINILKHAARDMHVDPEAMTKGIEAFTANMELARRGFGDFYGQLNQQYPELARKLKGDNPAQALKDYLDFLAKIPGAMEAAGSSQADAIQNQKRFTALGFGSDDLNKLVEQGPGKLAEVMADAAKNTPKTTAEMVAGAEALSKAAHDFDDAIERFQTEAGPFIFKQLTAATSDFTEAFKEVEATVKWFQANKDHPVKSLLDATEGAIDSQAEENRKPENQKHIIFDLPGAVSKLDHWIKGDQKQDASPASPTSPAVALPPVVPQPQGEATRSPLDKLRDAMERREGPPPIVLPPGFHPSSYDGGDADRGGLFHRASYGNEESGGGRGGFSGSLVWEFREAVASGAKAGVLGALREFQTQGSDGGVGGGDGGVIQASYGGPSPGAGRYGGGAAGRRAPALQASRGADAYTGTGGTAENAGPGFTSGMRARNLGNIGYFGQHEPGLVGPSNSRDVDHSIAMYATQEDGIRAAARLALRKYEGGMRDTASLIAGPKGWTPGALGPSASVNIARAMGLTNRDDLHLDQPAQMHKFLRGLATQEHGKAGSYYTDKMIDDALAGRGATAATGGVPGKTAGVSPVLTDMVKRASEILGTQLSVYSGLRSPEHNAAVGGAQNSMHLRGWATDLQAAGHPKGDRAFWERANGAMGQAASEFHQPFRWGGTFGGRYAQDNDHFDLTQSGPTPDALAKHMDLLDQNQRQLEAHQSKTLSTAHRILGWADKASTSRFAPHLAEESRKSILSEANKSGIGGSMTHKIEGGATVEIRGLPDHKGVKTRTSGMIEAVNLRRGGPMTQMG